jgi:hypothetical protein
MATDRPAARTQKPDFSYGTRELRQAQRAAPTDDESLEITGRSPRIEAEERGFDPYNSSGSFDRRKNWERIRKR